MGLGIAAIKLYLELYQRGILTNVQSVMDMGSQELHLTKVRFDELVRAAGISNYDDSGFSELEKWPESRGTSARNFYRLLGIDEYQCIDLSGAYNAIRHDLNLPFTDTSLYGRFDMVTDQGTNEHVFNIAETYQTMHRLCKAGGILVVSQAVYGGNGFHNFDLSFFETMAAANNYLILFSSFMVQVRRRDLSPEETRALTPNWESHHRRDQYHIPLSNDLLHTINWSSGDRPELGINYVFRKQSDADVQYGYQGEYQAQIAGNYGYHLQFLPDPPSRSYVPVRAFSRSGTEQDVLDSFSGRTVARHLVKKLGKRVRFW